MAIFSVASLALFSISTWLVSYSAVVGAVSIESALSSGMPVTTLTNQLVLDYVDAPAEERNFGLFVLFNTAFEKFQCPMCLPMDKTFQAIATLTASQLAKNSRVYFARAELEHCRSSFDLLYVDRMPTLFYFPPSGKGKHDSIERIYFDRRKGTDAATVMAFIEENLKLKINRGGPFDYGKLAKAALVIMGIIATLILFRQQIRTFTFGAISNSKLWTVFCMMFVLVMTSGVMWTRINGPPYTGQDESSNPVYISGGYQYQFGAESLIVAGLNGACAMAMILLTTRTPYIADKNRRRTTVMLLSAIWICAYGYLMVIFRRKMDWYPFSFGPF